MCTYKASRMDWLNPERFPFCLFKVTLARSPFYEYDDDCAFDDGTKQNAVYTHNKHEDKGVQKRKTV